MKKKQIAVILLTMSMALAAGCGNHAQDADSSVTQVDTKQTQEESSEELVKEQQAEEQQTQEPQGSEEQTDTQQQDTQQSANTSEANQQSESKTSSYTWNEITVSIPKEWEGKYEVEESEDGISFVQKASKEKMEEMGFLCGIYREEGMVLAVNVAGLTPLAFTAECTYYMVEPTDVCYYYEDDKIAAEYNEMHNLINSVASSIKVDKQGVQYNPDEYILPMSNTCRVKEEDLWNLSAESLKIARNEIYARHGRKFNDTSLQNYFDSCSWYKGTVAGEAFDEGVLNEIEKENLSVIKKVEEQSEYPKLYESSKKVSEDLDGDGKKETISYTFAEAGGTYEGTLTIDGKDFFFKDYGINLITPYEEKIGITDISPSYEGLEIAIMDYGPSDDLETHFFAYDGELYYIGSVGGFPFRELEGYSGFENEGMVKGIVRMDFIHTCYGYQYWSYDYENKKLEETEMQSIKLRSEEGRKLYEDLTVYSEMDKNSPTTIIPAQDKVFFLETDGKEWILVKGKDGSKGYMRIVDGKISPLSKEPTEVFSDLFFAG